MNKVIGSRPLFFGVVIELILFNIVSVADSMFSSPVLRGSYRILKIINISDDKDVLVPCSSG